MMVTPFLLFGGNFFFSVTPLVLPPLPPPSVARWSHHQSTNEHRHYTVTGFGTKTVQGVVLHRVRCREQELTINVSVANVQFISTFLNHCYNIFFFSVTSVHNDPPVRTIMVTPFLLFGIKIFFQSYSVIA